MSGKLFTRLGEKQFDKAVYLIVHLRCSGRAACQKTAQQLTHQALKSQYLFITSEKPEWLKLLLTAFLYYNIFYYIILYNDPQESTMTVQQGKAHYHVEVLLRI